MPMQEPSAAGHQAERSRSIDERCAEVPIRLVPMRVPAAGGEGPMVDRLALVGEPVTSVIGRPILATSDVDTAGRSIVYFGAIAEKAPTGTAPKDLAIIVTTAMFAGFFVFVGGMLALESPGGSPFLPAALMALLSMPLVGYLSYRFSRRPDFKGWTCVVGEDGFQIGTVKDGVFDRIVLSYADPSDVWFEGTGVGVLHGSTTAVSVNRTLTIRSADDQSITLQQFGYIDRSALLGRFSVGPNRVEAERFIALGEAWERARVVRLAHARAELAAGRALVLPLVDGRRLTLTPSPAGTTLAITRGGKELLRGESRDVGVRLIGGTYELTAGDARETVERFDLGNPYVIDALFLGDVGAPIPSGGPFPRAALAPAELATRGR